MARSWLEWTAGAVLLSKAKRAMSCALLATVGPVAELHEDATAAIAATMHPMACRPRLLGAVSMAVERPDVDATARNQ